MSGDPVPRWYNFERIDHEYEAPMGSRRHGDDNVEDLEGTGIEHAEAIGILPGAKPVASSSMLGDGQRPTIVQDAIDRKAKKLPVYRRQCSADDMWLLVVGSADTGGALMFDDVVERVFTSPYNRTIFLELFEGRCMDLKTTWPATAGTNP